MAAGVFGSCFGEAQVKGFEPPVPRWSTSRMSCRSCTYGHIAMAFAGISVAAAPPGPPARKVNASRAAGLRFAGMTTTLSPIIRPFGLVRFSGTRSVPQRAGMYCATHGFSGRAGCESSATAAATARTMTRASPGAAGAESVSALTRLRETPLVRVPGLRGQIVRIGERLDRVLRRGKLVLRDAHRQRVVLSLGADLG